MKHFILISIMALMCLGCNGQPTALTNIPDMEYGDCEPNTEPEINYIMFDLSNILEFAYNNVDREYYIDYDDPDAFDLDNLAYRSGMDKWYADYIMVQLTEKDFFELLADVNKSKKEQWDITMSEKWVLKEVATPVEGGMNYKYYLIKNPVTPMSILSAEKRTPQRKLCRRCVRCSDNPTYRLCAVWWSYFNAFEIIGKRLC